MKTSPEKADTVLRKVSEGYERGCRSKNLLTVPVLERLAEPLELVRKDLGIEAFQSK